MPVRLIESLATTEALADVFSDRQILRAMLDFEVALARVQARLEVIPRDAAEAIEKAAASFDASELARETLRAGTPAIPFVKALTEQARSRFVHWGATSQDVVDTAFVLLLKQALPLLEADHVRLDSALGNLAEQHKGTIMLGRTLLQPAPPITFGLKAAGWKAAARRGWARVESRFTEALLLQFGGASGTLASLGDKGDAVGQALAEELGLPYPDAPWHAHRDRLAALMAACGVETGSLGKMARDISLLMQGEVGEVAEPSSAGRGGSSAMPHKHNPIACSLTLAAAHRVPGLVAAFLTSMVQEHERGVGGWQAEWPTVAAVVQATGLAIASMAEAAEGLTVDPVRMRSNIEATRGVIFAERVVMLLGESLGRDAAHKLLQEAARRSVTEDRRLIEVLKDIPEITRVIPLDVLRELDTPEDYLGAAEEFRKRL
ncbi:MAG TPA: 3-carboxy-cis,cis-muconate cycloisomerase [Bryobacteraceae bacterium]|jgi:3-carboxy-cis,cis-muconate cycloisomerase|nr:3-carboxy-cis,cis-muconate cycloisomerase [Bryobacteraceae bacterium]